MDTRGRITKFAKSRREFGTQDLVQLLKVSRQTLSEHLSRLVAEGLLQKTGATRAARYAWNKVAHPPSPTLASLLMTKNIQGLEEDKVMSEIILRLRLGNQLSENGLKVFSYAFTEILNNAIDHSQSKKCKIKIEIRDRSVCFAIRDFGIGAFANVQGKFRLKNEFEALEHLFKGRQTTDPKRHTGQGIFFTSRIADRFQMKSHRIEAIRDNEKDDFFVKDIRIQKGTEVFFSIRRRTKKTLKTIFEEFTNEDYEFDKNTVHVKLSQNTEALSRSEARRLLYGLDKFKRITFDFSGVKECGQAFADEIFRVYANHHPGVELTFTKASPGVAFMITKAMRQV